MTHADREQVKILTEKIDTMNVRMHSLSELCDGFYKDWGIALARVAELERQLADTTVLDSYARENQQFHDRFTAVERALRKYGNHTAECGLETERTGSPDYQCTCGFADAITCAVSTALAPPIAPDAGEATP